METDIIQKKKTNTVPKLRFKEFEREWEEKKYEDIFTFFTTNSYSRDKLNYEKTGVRNIHYGDIHTKFQTQFHILKEVVPYINADVDLSHIKEENYCQEGDLIIADASEDYNDIGKTIEIISLDNEKTLAGLHTFLARPFPKSIHKGFPGYLVQTWKFRKQVMTIAQGTKVLGLSTTRMKKLKINLPSLSEQQKIASFFSEFDKKIQQLIRKKELLDTYKKGMMQKLFSQEIRFKPALSRAEGDEVGKEYPEWEFRKLNQFVTAIKRKVDQPTNVVLSISAGKGFLHQEERFNQIIAGSSLAKYTLLKKNEFSYNRGNSKTYTYGCIYKLTDYDEALVPNIYRSFKLKNGDPEFFEQLFISKYLDRQLRRLISSSARMDGLLNIGQEDFYKCKVPFPCVEEQKQIGKFLKEIDKKIEAVAQQIEKTQSFKKGLLQQMFV